MADNLTQRWAAEQMLLHPDATPEQKNAAAEILQGAKEGAANDNLGATLQFGVPFTNKRLNTGIPLPKELMAGLVGAGQTVDSIAQTGKQLYNAATGNGAANAQQAADEQNTAGHFKDLKDAMPWSTGIGQVAGNAAPFLGTSAGLARLGLGGARLLPGIANSAASGAITGAAEYAPDASQHAAQALVGGIGGAAGDLGGRVLGRLVQPFHGQNLQQAYANAQAAKAAIPGITIPTMQQLGSKTGQMAEVGMMNLPTGANLAGELAASNKTAINQAANKTMGMSGDQVFIGAKGMAPDELAGSARQVVGDVIDASLAGGEVMVGSKGVRKIDSLTKAMNSPKSGLAGEQKDIYNQAAQLVVDSLSPTTGHKGIITGEAFQSLRQGLNDLMGKASGNGQAAIVNLRNIVDKEALDSLGPKAAADFKQGNKQWSALEQIKRAIDSPTTPGNVSPLRLKNATNPDLAAIARYGQNFRPYPDSGTAQRALWQQILLNPMTLGGIAGGGVGMATDNPMLALAGIGGGLGAQALMRGSLRGTGADFLAKLGMSPTATAIRKSMVPAGGLLGSTALEKKYDPYNQ